MKLPSKITPYNDSLISYFPIILNELETQDMPVMALYKTVSSKINNVTDFLQILDCLYGLGIIEYIDGKEVLHYVA